jgi:nitroimidazol reductase NimA-like FMN-containing flavoprotein (pyridoxamine 5'-phosphate oxidase superfamily)
MDTSPDERAALRDLTPDECWALAASQPVGRLAWSGAQGPTVIPVNFEVSGRAVHVRTTAYSALGRECEDSAVAFEIDSFDAGARTGWSVLMRGYARFDFHGGDGSDTPDVWAAGTRALRVTVEVDEVSGRRIG